MRATVRILVTFLAIAGFSLGVPATTSAADDCGGCGGSGHSSDGGGKGPKFQGGDRGSEHSSQVHKGGTHHHDSSTTGNKSIERKIFAADVGAKGKGGPKFAGGKSGESDAGHDSVGDHHDGSTGHSDSAGGGHP